MIRKTLVCGLLLVGLSVSASGDDKHDHLPAPPKNAGLDKMKTLVGTWVTANNDGKPTDEVVSVIKVTAGGSAIHETLFPGQPHEMVSIYTVTDGPFAETKELIAGFSMIEAASREEAIEWAKRIPFQEGEVEVRPLFELTDFPVDPAEQPDGWRDKEEQFRATAPPRKPGTARYIGLLKADKNSEAGVMPDEKFLSDMGAFMEEGMQAGVFLSGEGLQPSSKSARVRFSGPQRLVTDGPFIETKELVAGYVILQFTSPAKALEWTKRFVEVDAPGRLNGECECEIRPLFEFENFGSSEAIERFRKLEIGTKK